MTFWETQHVQLEYQESECRSDEYHTEVCVVEEESLECLRRSWRLRLDRSLRLLQRLLLFKVALLLAPWYQVVLIGGTC